MLSTEKKMHNLKAESYVLFGRHFLGPQTQETASQITLGKLFLGDEGAAGIFRSFCNKGEVLRKSTDYYY